MKTSRDVFSSLKATFDDFHGLKEIGAGKDCVVYSGQCRALPQVPTVVVKAYNKKTLSRVKVRSIRREARMMESVQKARVPNVVGFYGAFQDASCMYIVMEFCASGDLLEKLLSEGRAMTERRVVSEVAVPLLISLSHMHKMSLIHRDIKLENIFVDEHGGVKFGDFGLTMSMKEERGISPVGTVEYMAPELCKLPPAEMIMSGKVHPDDLKSVDEKVDIWALGVTMYELVTGRSPFQGENKAALKQNIIRMNIKSVPKFLTGDCSDFIAKMLTYDPDARSSADDLLVHPWITKHARHPPVAPQMEALGSRPTGNMDHGDQRPRSQRPKSASGTAAEGRHAKSTTKERPTAGSPGAIKARHASEGSPAPPLLSPESILLVTPKRKLKFGDRMAKLLPTYGAKSERNICMRGVWNLQISDSESASDEDSD